MSEKRARYLQKKHWELSDQEKRRIRDRVARGDGNVYELARELGCVPVQVAGVKAAITRGQ